MPSFHSGNMFTVLGLVDHFVINTCASVNKDGALIMGSGLAKQIAEAVPGITKEIGEAIIRARDKDVYGVIIGPKVSIFQVKFHSQDFADLRLIAYSAGALAGHAENHPDQTYALEYPGIANSQLTMAQVSPLLEQLPDNVQVWSRN